MNLFEPTHLILILLIIVVLFGAKKIPELMNGVGKGYSEFRKGVEEGKKSLTSVLEETKTETPDESTHAKRGSA